MQQIASENVAYMLDHAAIVQRINENEARWAWVPWVSFVLAGIFLFYLSGLGILLGVGLVGVSYWLRNYLRSKAPVELEYEMDEEDSRRVEALRGAVDALGRCQRLWQINAFGKTNDRKRNGGAAQIVSRSGATTGVGAHRSFTANVKVPHLELKSETLYFLPDMIFVYQKKQFGSISYANLQVAASITRFNEEQAVPSDTKIVGSTWRYVNKTGGPDRRFRKNQEIPIVLYGEAAIHSESGLRIALQTSTVAAAEAFVAGIRFAQSQSTRMAYLPAATSPEKKQ